MDKYLIYTSVGCGVGVAMLIAGLLPQDNGTSLVLFRNFVDRSSRSVTVDPRNHMK